MSSSEESESGDRQGEGILISETDYVEEFGKGEVDLKVPHERVHDLLDELPDDVDLIFDRTTGFEIEEGGSMRAVSVEEGNSCWQCG